MADRSLQHCNIFIKDLEENTKSLLIKLIEDTKISRVVNQDEEKGSHTE